MIDILYTKNSDELIKDIDILYSKNTFCVVSFLYFANAITYHILDSKTSQSSTDKKYIDSLQNADFLLPDGIALQIWAYFMKKPKLRLQNLNGTDLTPKILSYFSKKYPVTLYIYSLYDEKIGKDQNWLHKAISKLKQEYNINIIHGYQSHYNQRGKDYPFKSMDEVVDRSGQSYNIFLNCTGSPFQENWLEDNKDRFENNKMIVLNVGGFLDFYSGFEKRAPNRIIKIKIGETFWRICTNPKKNAKKFIAMFGVFPLLWKKIFTRN